LSEVVNGHERIRSKEIEIQERGKTETFMMLMATTTVMVHREYACVAVSGWLSRGEDDGVAIRSALLG
jgi:hypothetical protein